MLELTQEEVGLLQELDKKERTIRGNKPRQGLNRLINAGYVREQSLNLSDTIYSITTSGRKVLAQASIDTGSLCRLRCGGH